MVTLSALIVVINLLSHRNPQHKHQRPQIAYQESYPQSVYQLRQRYQQKEEVEEVLELIEEHDRHK